MLQTAWYIFKAPTADLVIMTDYPCQGNRLFLELRFWCVSNWHSRNYYTLYECVQSSKTLVDNDIIKLSSAWQRDKHPYPVNLSEIFIIAKYSDTILMQKTEHTLLKIQTLVVKFCSAREDFEGNYIWPFRQGSRFSVSLFLKTDCYLSHPSHNIFMNIKVLKIQST